MKLRFPRLLPVTIAVMATLLASKSVSFVRAAVPHAESVAAAPVSKAQVAPAPAGPAAGETPTAGAVPAPAMPRDPPVGDAERALLVELRQRRIELDSRARALELREQVRAAAETRLAARLDELNALQHRLEQLDAGRRAHDEANWRAMVKLYETMKPRDAAAIFNDLERPVLLQIVDRMQERRAAMVLAAMQPERARDLTAALAAMRNKAEAVPDPPATARSAASDKP